MDGCDQKVARRAQKNVALKNNRWENRETETEQSCRDKRCLRQQKLNFQSAVIRRGKGGGEGNEDGVKER